MNGLMSFTTSKITKSTSRGTVSATPLRLSTKVPDFRNALQGRIKILTTHPTLSCGAEAALILARPFFYVSRQTAKAAHFYTVTVAEPTAILQKAEIRQVAHR